MSSEESTDPRSVRLAELLGHLSDDPPQTTNQLAERIGVTSRTINRDIEILESIGIEVERDPKTSTVSVASATFLKPFDFTLDEASALMTAVSSFSQRRGVPGVSLSTLRCRQTRAATSRAAASISQTRRSSYAL